jgi:hypothetical protein
MGRPGFSAATTPFACGTGEEGAVPVSSEPLLEVLKLILAGSPLPEVLAVIAELVESQGEETSQRTGDNGQRARQLKFHGLLAGFLRAGTRRYSLVHESITDSTIPQHKKYLLDTLPLHGGDSRHPRNRLNEQ